ncbi:hypothetical protein CCP3SC15_2440005 [Gammaproteobacteria bacterium]
MIYKFYATISPIDGTQPVTFPIDIDLQDDCQPETAQREAEEKAYRMGRAIFHGKTIAKPIIREELK